MNNSAGVRRARLKAFGKINLGLKVLGRRPDGYHELRTVYQTISVADELEIEYEPAGEARLVVESSAPYPDNLVGRAALALVEATGIGGRIRIRLQKRIPAGAGLGGGSSDAAAVLLALPVLAGVRMGFNELLEVASRLGSDVPLFLLGGAVLGVGRGTEVYPLPELPPYTGVAVFPREHVSTPEAYRALGRGSWVPGQPAELGRFEELVAGFDAPVDLARLGELSENDFETVIGQQVPEFAMLREQLQAMGAQLVRLSGSGSALFGLFPRRDLAQRARRALQAAEARVFCLVNRRHYRHHWWRSLCEHMEGRTWPPQSRYGS